jgi:hypothetical protein
MVIASEATEKKKGAHAELPLLQSQRRTSAVAGVTLPRCHVLQVKKEEEMLSLPVPVGPRKADTDALRYPSGCWRRQVLKCIRLCGREKY